MIKSGKETKNALEELMKIFLAIAILISLFGGASYGYLLSTNQLKATPEDMALMTREIVYPVLLAICAAVVYLIYLAKYAKLAFAANCAVLIFGFGYGMYLLIDRQTLDLSVWAAVISLNVGVVLSAIELNRGDLFKFQTPTLKGLAE